MNEKLLNLTHQKRRTFKRHFLSSVHCELGLVGVSADKVFAAEAGLKEAFLELGFGESKKVVIGSFTMQTNPNEPAKMHHESQAVGLAFVSQVPKRELQIHGDKIVISDFAYDGFDNFVARLKTYCEEISRKLTLDKINKVGLRKINSIFIEPVVSYQDALSIFNPALFGAVRSGLLATEALKAAEDVTVLERNGYVCLLRSRFTKAPNPASYEASLDFDLVDRNLTSLPEVFDKALPSLNATHFDLFMWAATDDLIKLMEAT